VKKSLVTLPISRRINMMKGVRILDHDQLRAKALMANGHVETRAVGTPLPERISSQAENQAVSYVASIGVGSPATQCKRCSS
jgi:cathepsin E